ncbi:glycosyltransferase [Ningiella sp. W23]|uniref:glycosyltransferase n=1 Tax=Ningiella sp. W23 TaxID=3023715 RepID=UPI003756E7E1
MPKSFYFTEAVSIDYNFESVVAMATFADDNPLWLADAIDSVLQQDYSDFVFVIVVDGPVDQDISAIVEYAAKRDPRIVLAKSDANVGLSRCMNFVMDWCLPYHPKYFFRMDADDVSMPHRFATQVDYFKSHEDIDILGSALVEINELGEKVGFRTLPASHKKIKKMLTRRCSINHPTVAMRYSVIEKGYRFQEQLRNTQDYFFWIELIADGIKFHNLQEPLLKFRRVNDFYKRRGLGKSVNEFKARIFAMKSLKRMRIRYVVYACGVLCVRCMPAPLVKLAYKFDRYVLNR